MYIYIVYNAIHGLLGCSLAELGLQLVSSNTRRAGIRLTQRRACSKFMRGLFCMQAPVQWNSLPFAISGSNSLNIFKDQLFKYFLAKLH